MAILTIGLLKQIITNIPDEYEVEYDKKETIAPIVDRVEIDIDAKMLILK